MKKIEILGIRISTLNREEALSKIKEFLSSRKKHFIVTPNPEIILAARNDEELFYILNSADLAISDGIGLKFASWLSGKNLPRITGADLLKKILKLASEEGKRVGILNWKNGFSSRRDIVLALSKKYPGLKFEVENIPREIKVGLSEEFLESRPEILFVALGAPWQEKFIFHNLKKIPGLKLAIGIGGALDFITGKKKRAPKILRILGLEWLWRLLHQPNRSTRIFNAVIVFPFRLLRSKFYCPLFYRPNVACLLYKKEAGGYKIFIAERQDEKNHWQLPQGGTRHQNLMKAGERELKEEINCDKFIPKRAFKNIYKYKFGSRPGETSEKASGKRKYTGFRGQRQGLFIAEFTGSDENIKINFWDHSRWKWVDVDKLEESVHLVRKRATQRFLKKFKEMMKIS